MMIPLKFVGYPILIPWHDGDRSHGPHGITMGSARLSPFDHGMELETQLLGAIEKARCCSGPEIPAIRCYFPAKLVLPSVYAGFRS